MSSQIFNVLGRERQAFKPIHEERVGKALMLRALRRMKAEAGITCAYVCHAIGD